jgi:hypothetical protein
MKTGFPNIHIDHLPKGARQPPYTPWHSPALVLGHPLPRNSIQEIPTESTNVSSLRVGNPPIATNPSTIFVGTAAVMALAGLLPIGS